MPEIKSVLCFFHYPNNWGERRQTIGAPQSAVVAGDWKSNPLL